MMQSVSIAFLCCMCLGEALKLPMVKPHGNPSASNRGASSKIWAAAIGGSYERISSEHEAVCKDLQQPSAENYDLWETKTSFSQVGQDKRLASLLPSKGFFIESGAADGETNSNTLFYEMKGWNGLLVEPYPKNFDQILTKHRKAHSYNGALSITGESGTQKLTVTDCFGFEGECSTTSFSKNSKDETIAKDTLIKPKVEKIAEIDVKMAPLQSLLACLNQTTVDFWSLDVEGVEGKIVESFPFQDIEVGVLLIEMNKDKTNDNLITETMTKNGFEVCGTTHIQVKRKQYPLDNIFVNPKYYEKRGLRTPKEC